MPNKPFGEASTWEVCIIFSLTTLPGSARRWDACDRPSAAARTAGRAAWHNNAAGKETVAPREWMNRAPGFSP